MKSARAFWLLGFALFMANFSWAQESRTYSGATLGTAIALATQQGGQLKSLLMLLTFGMGASLPLLMISYGAQSFFKKYRTRLFHMVHAGKGLFGAIVIAVSLLILSGSDHRLEVWVMKGLPDFWVDLSTKF